MKIIHGKGQSDENFIIPATDSQGHSVRMWFRCVPRLGSLVEQVVQSKAFAYRTKGDFLRHAVHRHAEWISQQDDGAASTIGQVNALVTVLQDDEMNKDFIHVFNQLRKRVADHTANGDHPEAARLVLTVMRIIDRMPEGYWRSRYGDKVRAEYGELLRDAQKANLGRVEE